jgi:hypothetical protein
MQTSRLRHRSSPRKPLGEDRVPTYYKTALVLVTGEVISVSGQPPCRIADIDALYVVKVRELQVRRWTLRRSGPAVVTALTSSGVAIQDLVAAPGTALVMPALALAIGALASLASDLRGGTVSELWAITGAGCVRLFRSRNRATVAQVRRAVAEARRGCRP